MSDEINFVHLAHMKSLKGILAKYIKVSISSGKAWNKARKAAWKQAAKEKFSER